LFLKAQLIIIFKGVEVIHFDHMTTAQTNSAIFRFLTNLKNLKRDGPTEYWQWDHLVDRWLYEDILEEFFINPCDQEQISFNEYISMLKESSLKLGQDCELLKETNSPILRSSCALCNNCIHRSSHNCRNNTVGSTSESSDISPVTNSEIIIELHRCLCLMSFGISILKLRSERAKIRRGQEQLIFDLIGLRIDGNDLFFVRPDELLNVSPAVAMLVGLIDNARRLFPQVTHSAMTFLSLCVAQSPSALMARVDPLPLVSSTKFYLLDVAGQIRNPCKVERMFSFSCSYDSSLQGK